MTFKHEAQTPTVAFSTLGFLALFLSWAGMRRADLVAFILLGMAGGGVGMALGGEVRSQNREWGWKGIYKSLRHPSKEFVVAFFSHLPQLIISALIALKWRRDSERRDR